MRQLTFLALCLSFVFNLNAQSAEYGLASYYGDYLHGRPTASGEKYDVKKFTCAHKTLKMGTMVKVTRVDNNLSVIVKVNDRGPFVESRIVDLSRAAANHIGLDKEGLTKVKLEIMPNDADLTKSVPSPKTTVVDLEQLPDSFEQPSDVLTAKGGEEVEEKAEEQPAVESRVALMKRPVQLRNLLIGQGGKPVAVVAKPNATVVPPDAVSVEFYEAPSKPVINGQYSIQIAAYGDRINAAERIEKLEKQGFSNTRVSEVDRSGKTIYKVLIGSFGSRSEASQFKTDMSDSLGGKGFVVKVK